MTDFVNSHHLNPQKWTKESTIKNNRIRKFYNRIESPPPPKKNPFHMDAINAWSLSSFYATGLFLHSP